MCPHTQCEKRIKIQNLWQQKTKEFGDGKVGEKHYTA